MKGKLILASLVIAVGVGTGSYYLLSKDKATSNIESTTTTKTEKDTASSDKPKDESSKDAINPETEKQTKVVNGDIDGIKEVLNSNNIKANIVGDFSKDSKVTLSGSSNNISKIEYVGESKDGKLSRNLTIALKHPITKEFDINQYVPVKDLVEKITESPINDFEFSDSLTSKISSMKDSKKSYDFIVADNYKISIDINKSAEETVTIKVELK